ncbi:MAG TPA: hypothetical protein VMW31_05280 [Devosiaceae bacterium]|nr:hypothetical protein [Devosiaceae bacterium]
MRAPLSIALVVALATGPAFGQSSSADPAAGAPLPPADQAEQAE